MPVKDADGRAWDLVIKSWANGTEHRRVYVLEQVLMSCLGAPFPQCGQRMPGSPAAGALHAALELISAKVLYRQSVSRHMHACVV